MGRGGWGVWCLGRLEGGRVFFGVRKLMRGWLGWMDTAGMYFGVEEFAPLALRFVALGMD
jgi:hypothetical protein